MLEKLESFRSPRARHAGVGLLAIQILRATYDFALDRTGKRLQGEAYCLALSNHCAVQPGRRYSLRASGERNVDVLRLNLWAGAVWSTGRIKGRQHFLRDGISRLRVAPSN